LCVDVLSARDDFRAGIVAAAYGTEARRRTFLAVGAFRLQEAR